jgi:hypothetical protein
MLNRKGGDIRYHASNLSHKLKKAILTLTDLLENISSKKVGKQLIGECPSFIVFMSFHGLLPISNFESASVRSHTSQT